MPNQQSPGGSPFARYSGEQVNQIPEGYVQAMGQDPFANFVTSAMSAYQSFKKLKTDETAAGAAAKKADNEGKALDIKEKKDTATANASDVKGMLDTYNALQTGVGRGQVDLDDDAKLAPDDTKKLSPAARAARMRELELSKQNASWILNEIVRRQMPAQVPAGSPQSKGSGVGRLAQPNGQPQPPPLLARPGQNQNFNSAPAGQGTTGGATQDNVDELQTPESGDQEAPAPAGEKPASGEPSVTGANTPAQGLPEKLRGDLDYDLLPSTLIANKHSGKQWTANIVVNDDGVINIAHNVDFTDPEKVAPDVLANNIREYRVAHLVKYILDNNLEKNVRLSPQEFARTADYNTPENSPIWYRVQKAYALATRNINNNTGQFDIDENRFSQRFGTDRGYSPSDYFHGGSPDMTDLVRQQSRSTEAAEAKRREIEQNVGTLLGAVANTQSKVLGENDPYAAKRTALLMQAEDIKGKMRRLIGDAESQTSLANQLKAVEAEIAIVSDQAQAWQSRRKDQLAANETSMRVIELATKSIAPTGVTKDEIQTGREVGEAVKSYVGANYGEDLTPYFGYISSGLKRVPYAQAGESVRFREIKNSQGQTVVDRMDIPEFVSWASVHAPHHLIRYAAMQPNKENRDAALEETRVFNMSVNPINSLFSVLKSGPGPIDKLFDPKVSEAAAVQRNILISSFRKALIGVGNPSNFEQEIMRDIIPDPKQWTALNAQSLAKMKGIAFMTVLTHHNRMVQHGFEMTQDSLDMYNNALKGVIGRELTMEEFSSITSYWDGLKARHVTGGYIPGVTTIAPQSSRDTFNMFDSFVNETVNRSKPKK